MTTGTKSTTERNTVDHPSIPLSEGDSHPWTMPPVNPKCSEKDSCNAMRCGSVGAGTGVLVPYLRTHPQQLQDHTEGLTTAFLPHRHAFPHGLNHQRRAQGHRAPDTIFGAPRGNCQGICHDPETLCQNVYTYVCFSFKFI